jgi:hypothetical protein
MGKKSIDFLFTDQNGILWWKTVNFLTWKVLENIRKAIFVCKIIPELSPSETSKLESCNIVSPKKYIALNL